MSVQYRTTLVILIAALIGGSFYMLGKREGGKEALTAPPGIPARQVPSPVASSVALFTVGTVNSVEKEKLTVTTYKDNTLPAGKYRPAVTGTVTFILHPSTIFTRVALDTSPSGAPFTEKSAAWSDLKPGDQVSVKAASSTSPTRAAEKVSLLPPQ